QIGEVMIAEKAGDGLTSHLKIPRPVEPIGVCGQATCIPEESDIQSAAQNTFVGAKPLKSFLGGNRQRLIGDRAFRWPKARGRRAEDSRVIVASALQLLSSVFGTAIRATRQRRAGICDSCYVRIAD